VHFYESAYPDLDSDLRRNNKGGSKSIFMLSHPLAREPASLTRTGLVTTLDMKAAMCELDPMEER
jgi:hypothetical protein